MANYYATARTNYFAVKDEAAFLAWAEKLDVTVNQRRTEQYRAGFMLAADKGDQGGWPTLRFDAADSYEEVDFVAELAGQLADGEIAVLMESGAEKFRYVSGRAVAVRSDGDTVVIDLDDIYREAAELFDVDVTTISRCEY